MRLDDCGSYASTTCSNGSFPSGCVKGGNSMAFYNVCIRTPWNP